MPKPSAEELAPALLCVIRALLCELLGREGIMCYFYEAKSIQNLWDVCVVGFNGFLLSGKTKMSRLSLVSHSSVMALGLLLHLGRWEQH